MPHRILVVDDEPAIREVARASLELIGGHEVLTASSGEEGIAIALAEQPDAILMDVMMPGLDGPAAVALLRADERTRGIPVVLLTADIEADARIRRDALEVVAVISKPFDALRLAGHLTELLDW